MKKIVLVLSLLVAGLLFTQFARLPAATGRTDFTQQANLALRRTAHHLLRDAGDTTSRIPAVQQVGTATFQIRLDHALNYKKLPALLQQSLALYALDDPYDVAVLDCTAGTLQLGYTVADLTQQNDVPCVGRDQQTGCYTIRVSFTGRASQNQLPIPWGLWIAGFVVVGGAYILWQKSSRTTRPPLSMDLARAESVPLIQVGNLTFDALNQTVEVADQSYTLTYREAKLLHLFLRHPNQLLTRDFILKSVWEDEGIIVGRSVDVFVSRLRKHLKPDPGLHIIAVHGVGYRLEVRG
ncbi:winged helix-turn-helix domain-containing protein [Spirosoma spitsbergense]|uniref:winged helix-turn-helix domain-containing protein n=1 Tax=Spirosoma spitsbergense TaxID=431554 RepID=UPI0003647993|nr:winged helix-turn-helix domain-containing protein [Spirosoma spitsbergense]